jgi:hypothetical protein
LFEQERNQTIDCLIWPLTRDRKYIMEGIAAQDIERPANL